MMLQLLLVVMVGTDPFTLLPTHPHTHCLIVKFLENQYKIFSGRI